MYLMVHDENHEIDFLMEFQMKKVKGKIEHGL